MLVYIALFHVAGEQQKTKQLKGRVKEETKEEKERKEKTKGGEVK